MNRRAIMKVTSLLALILCIPGYTVGQIVPASGWESLGPEGGNLIALTRSPVSGDLFTVNLSYPSLIYRSTNDGFLWERVGQIDGYYVRCLQADPQRAERLYAAMFYLGVGSDLYMYVSSDRGAGWTRRTFAGESMSTYYTLGLAINKTDPAKLTITGYCENPNISPGIVRPFMCSSSDAGETWTIRHFNRVASTATNVYCVASDPDDPNTFYVGCDTVASGYLIGVLFKSTDKGTTWKNITGTVVGYPCDVLFDPGVSSKMYVAAGGAGVFRSTDRGITWMRGSGPVMASKVWFDPQNSSIVYSYWGTTIYRSTDSGASWNNLNKSMAGGNCQGIIIHPTMTNKFYVATLAGFYRSEDTGQSWTFSNAGLLCSNVPAVRCVPSTPSVVYLSSMNSGLHRTTNGLAAVTSSGLNWEKVSEDTYCEGILHIEISPSNPSSVYIQEGPS